MGNIEKFNMVAAMYDTKDRIETTAFTAEVIRRHLDGKMGKTAMDLGCGTGLVGMNFIDEFERVLFVDASEKMIEITQKKIDAANIKNAQAVCCDVENESTDHLKADCVMVVQTLLHIKDTEGFLKRAYEMTNTGGHLVIVDFDKNLEIESDEVHNGFVQRELCEAVKKAGFKTAVSEAFFKGEKMFMKKDATVFVLIAEK